MYTHRAEQVIECAFMMKVNQEIESIGKIVPTLLFTFDLGVYNIELLGTQ